MSYKTRKPDRNWKQSGIETGIVGNHINGWVLGLKNSFIQVLGILGLGQMGSSISGSRTRFEKNETKFNEHNQFSGP